jgi:hypothetical protein
MVPGGDTMSYDIVSSPPAVFPAMLFLVRLIRIRYRTMTRVEAGCSWLHVKRLILRNDISRGSLATRKLDLVGRTIRKKTRYE